MIPEVGEARDRALAEKLGLKSSLTAYYRWPMDEAEGGNGFIHTMPSPVSTDPIAAFRLMMWLAEQRDGGTHVWSFSIDTPVTYPSLISYPWGVEAYLRGKKGEPGVEDRAGAEDFADALTQAIWRALERS